MKLLGEFGALLLPLAVCSIGPLWASQAAEPAAAATLGGAGADEGGPTAEGASDALPAVETGITLGADIVGDVSIRDVEGYVVAQLEKRGGREVVVPLDPGKYEIECVTEPRLFHAAINVEGGERIVIGRDQLRLRREKQARHWLDRSKQRERARPSRPTYDLRVCRLTIDMGGWANGHGATSVIVTDDGIESHNGGFLGGMSFGYRATPEWMFTLGVTSRLIDAYDGHWYDVDGYDHASFLTTFSVGARYYLPPLAATSQVKPYVSAGIGPTFGTEVESDGWHHDGDTVRSEAVFGGFVGAGVDLHATSWLVLGTDVSYYISPRLSEAVGGRRDTKGFAFAFQIGASFGRRLPAPEKAKR
jgi:outer membrane protein W